MADNELTGKVGLDVTDFKAGLAAMNREIRVIESGFRATAAGLDDWAKSATGLEARIKALNSEITIQKNKVGALRGEYEKVVAEKGATSRAAQELQVKLNKETETLNKMELELGKTEKALSEMGDESKDAAKGAEQLAKDEKKAEDATHGLRGALERLKGGLKNVSTDFRNLGTKVLKGVAIGLAGVGVAAAGAAVGIGKFITGAAASADEIVESAEKLGISTDKYQEFGFIAEQTGTDIESIARAFARTTKAIAGADAEGSAIAKTLASIGVATRDSNGNLRDTEAVFGDIITSLGEMTDETQRDIIAQELFGKSYQELVPLINLGADGLAAMTKEAHDVGAVMSEEAVTGLADFNDKLAAMKAGFRGLLGRFLAPLIPIVTKITDKFQEWLASPSVQKGLKNITDGIGRFADKVSEVIDKLFAGDIAGALKEFIPPEVVDQIMKFANAFNDFIQNTLLPFVEDHAEEIKGALIGIGAALAAAGIVAAIAGIAGAIASLANPVGLIIALAGLIGAAWAGNWGGIRDTLTEFWNNTAKPIFEKLGAWLGENIPKAIAVLKRFWENILLPAIRAVWNFIQTKIFPIFETLWGWLSENIPKALETLSGFWENTLLPAIRAVWSFIETDLYPLFDSLRELLGVTLKLALEVLAGIWENILKPALEKVWAFIEENLLPILKDMWEWIDTKLGPVIKFLVDNALKNLKNGFEAVRDAIKWVIDKIKELIEKLKNVKLPDWLTPGSPTPFELGLRGIADAMDDINKKNLNITGGSGGGGTTNNNQRVFYVSPMTVAQGERSLADEIRFLEMMS